MTTFSAPRRAAYRTALLAALLLPLAACERLHDLVDDLGEAPIPEVAGLITVAERYATERDPQDNVDSVAVWHGPDGQHWLLATAKETDRLLVYDASTGKPLQKVGQSGTELGQFERPNGVFVIDDLALVVERDNHRVQVLRLPDFEPLMHFGGNGDRPLRKPYGLWAQKLASGDYRVWVTDNYETADGEIPPAAELDQRVQQFLLRETAEGFVARPERHFGDTEGRGVLKIVESIWGDAAQGLLMVADEEQHAQRNIKVYRLDGRFSGQRMGGGVFHFQPEGIALYTCADGSGWWFAADQGKQANYFHVFERRRLEYHGSFSGQITLNTDGVWMTQHAFPGFAEGAFFAVHDDGNVAAFDLREVLRAMNLKACAPPAP